MSLKPKWIYGLDAGARLAMRAFGPRKTRARLCLIPYKTAKHLPPRALVFV